MYSILSSTHWSVFTSPPWIEDPSYPRSLNVWVLWNFLHRFIVKAQYEHKLMFNTMLTIASHSHINLSIHHHTSYIGVCVCVCVIAKLRILTNNVLACLQNAFGTLSISGLADYVKMSRKFTLLLLWRKKNVVSDFIPPKNKRRRRKQGILKEMGHPWMVRGEGPSHGWMWTITDHKYQENKQY